MPSEQSKTPRSFLTTRDWSRAQIDALLDLAASFKQRDPGPLLRGKAVALVFFNPSLRTRTSMELGAWRLGAHAVVLEPGKGAWPIEFTDSAVMDGDAEEHAREVARVLSSYCDLIAVRKFPGFQDWSVDRRDEPIKALARHASVPVMNLETIEHPCQELAHALALRERLGSLQNRKYVLTWTYHPRPLNTAVANSALLIATKLGMDVTLLCPDERYLLDERYLGAARDNAAAQGGSLTISHDIDAAYEGADVVYAKSWGALPFYGNWAQEKPIRDANRHFIVDERKMALTNGALFGHCLPMRRNIKATDAVVDSPGSIIIEEAANRLPTQQAVMATLLGAKPTGAPSGVPITEHKEIVHA
ncbi:MAG: N-acetylornithine carbamoyltransferase [Phycisphaeraceae bacterium]|nr:N-acetylornithine carbamoyltransferase [Phycisphaeraceae bacterium]MCB9848661.1 N-acetylornithine carbamoyltransferase [Phycisphaeraceae bacterium]